MIRGLSLCVLTLLMGATAGCGTRMSHQDVMRAATSSGIPPATSAGDTEHVESAGVTGRSETDVASAIDAGGSSPASKASADTRPAAGVSRGSLDARNGVSTGQNERAPGKRSPLVVASVGTLSGPAGNSVAPYAQGAQVWARDVARRGGVNGHEVKFILYDDGGDPARHRAQVQEAVEQRHAIAFLANAEALTGKGSVDYLTAKRIPVIGSSGGIEWGYSSPMYFPHVSDAGASFYTWVAAVADQLVPARKSKLGSIVCIEAQGCTTLANTISKYGKSLGFDVVYQGKASLTEPDYTAQCLSARNAGAQAILVSLDANSVGRLAASCARQDYRPVIAVFGGINLERLKGDPNLDGMVSSNGVFPWFWTGTPAADEFQRAMTAFGGAVPRGGGAATGWAAGKLLERAARDIAEPPTSEALLRGLWSLKEDTLDGLTMPLTFAEGRPAPQRACWFNVAIRRGAWVSPDGFRLRCRPWNPTTGGA